MSFYADPFKSLTNTPIPAILGCIIAEVEHAEEASGTTPLFECLWIDNVYQPDLWFGSVMNRHGRMQHRQANRNASSLANRRMCMLVSRLDAARLQKRLTHEEVMQIYMGRANYRIWLRATGGISDSVDGLEAASQTPASLTS